MADNDNETPRRGKWRMILLGGIALVAVGGGGAGAAIWMTGGLQPRGAAEDPNRPKLVAREGIDAARVAVAQEAARTGRPDPAVFQSSYIKLEDSFTSNLSDGAAYAQVELALSTFYDERVAANVDRHKIAIRSAILLKLAEQDAAVLATTAGKEQLRVTLTRTVNRLLTEREGFGGIDAVHYTGFVMQ